MDHNGANDLKQVFAGFWIKLLIVVLHITYRPGQANCKFRRSMLLMNKTDASAGLNRHQLSNTDFNSDFHIIMNQPIQFDKLKQDLKNI